MKHLLFLLSLTLPTLTLATSKEFTIERTFNADAKSIYSRMTDPAQYVQWMGPAGAKMTFTKTDVK